MQRVADVPQRLQQLDRVGLGRVIFDQCLLVRQAHGHLVDSRLTPERLLDRAGAERAMQSADPGADARTPGLAGRLL